MKSQNEKPQNGIAIFWSKIEKNVEIIFGLKIQFWFSV